MVAFEQWNIKFYFLLQQKTIESELISICFPYISNNAKYLWLNLNSRGFNFIWISPLTIIIFKSTTDTFLWELFTVCVVVLNEDFLYKDIYLRILVKWERSGRIKAIKRENYRRELKSVKNDESKTKLSLRDFYCALILRNRIFYTRCVHDWFYMKYLPRGRTPQVYYQRETQFLILSVPKLVWK